MNKKISRIIGIIMLLIAVIFLIFAFNNPQMSFPWSNSITYLIYGLYIIIMIIFFIAPFKKDN